MSQLPRSAGIYFRCGGINTVCITKRGDTSRTGVPCGKVRDGEDPWEAAVRETFEETGFDVSECKPLKKFTCQQGHYMVTVFMIDSPIKEFKSFDRSEGRVIYGDATFLVGRDNPYRSFNERMLREFGIL